MATRIPKFAKGTRFEDKNGSIWVIRKIANNADNVLYRLGREDDTPLFFDIFEEDLLLKYKELGTTLSALDLEYSIVSSKEIDDHIKEIKEIDLKGASIEFKAALEYDNQAVSDIVRLNEEHYLRTISKAIIQAKLDIVNELKREIRTGLEQKVYKGEELLSLIEEIQRELKKTYKEFDD